MNLVFRFQELHSGLFNFWLILHDKQTDEGLVHGVMTKSIVEKVGVLLNRAGLAIEIKQAFAGEFCDEPKPETKLAQQQELFTKEN